ncbi:MAG: shikimate dehydrogenase [Pseudomonadota bacterium]
MIAEGPPVSDSPPSSNNLSMTDQYYVIGNPIEHSRSPEIHRQFAQQTQQQMYYGKFLAPIGGFKPSLKALIDEGIRGANVTVPFKEDAFLCCNHMTHRAERARAINTLIMGDDGKCFGDNTDGIGLLTDLTQNYGLDISHQRVLILGAGGAVRGILEPLLDHKPDHVVIANRTPGRARSLARDFSDLGETSGCGFSDLEGKQFDLIINGTSAGLSGEVPPIPTTVLHKNSTTYDLMYGREPTEFAQWSRRAGAAHSLDGLGMLVEQAAEAFYLWRAKRPDSRAVIKSLRS